MYSFVCNCGDGLSSRRDIQYTFFFELKKKKGRLSVDIVTLQNDKGVGLRQCEPSAVGVGGR